MATFQILPAIDLLGGRVVRLRPGDFADSTAFSDDPLALGNPALAAELIGRHGQDRIAVALDVRDGAAVGHGWVPGGPGVPVQTAMSSLLDAGVRWFEVTAVARDGLLG